ncbi:hypothetical protein F5887DRAFT_964507 [Amanita rubescens]|nr:hypothetical protein F5887DRAFT_981397 [Amanita rubescens]KAF8346005.1 hypothetical protein F5887DRAFT_964507 [Amanita rubescens]
MPKLHLKSTPTEDVARRLRKKEKKEERRKRRNADASSSTSKRRRVETTEEPSRKWASSDEDEPGPSSRKSHKHDTMQAEVEEREFRQRMFEEMEIDDRLDTLEARLNDHTHVPGRWRRGGSSKIGDYAFETPDIDMASCLDPRYMEDEEYTEWIRMGMHRLKHAEEYAEQQRRKAAHATRVAQIKKEKEDMARLEQAAAKEREKKRQEQWVSARQLYDQKWKTLLSDGDRSHEGWLKFVDIPWPIPNAYKTGRICIDDLTEDGISTFLLSSRVPVPIGTEKMATNDAKEKKDKLREAMLRFHPDKFEGRIMKLVAEVERGNVREGIAQVVRVLNRLLSDVQ